MDNKQVNVNLGFKLEGFVDIDLVSTKDHVTRRMHNTITKCGKQFLIDKSAGKLLDMSAESFGDFASTNRMLSNRTSDYGGQGVFNRNTQCLTNVLLNLGTEATALTETSTFINVFDTDNLALPSKLVGYANSNLTPANNGKEGKIDLEKGEYLIDAYTACKRWKYDAGVATGTIDTIAMMPASTILGNDGDGISISKCLDACNRQNPNFTNFSTGFLIPGVAGYTANDEVLLNYNTDGNAKHKVNLTTGAVTDLTDTDPFFIPTVQYGVTIVDMKVIGNYLYVLGCNLITSSIYGTVKVYDIANSMTEVASITVTVVASTCTAKLLYKDNELYVTSCSSLDSYGTSVRLTKLSLGSGGYYNSVASTSADYTSIFTIPTGISKEKIVFGNYGTNYIMYVRCGSSDTFDYISLGYVFSDVTDIAGSIVDIIDGITANDIPYYAGANLGWLKVGQSRYGGASSTTNNIYDLSDCLKYVDNTGTDVSIDMRQQGVWWTKDKWWTNVLSFVKLNTAIVKQDTDIMYVSYGYKIV